jgi:Ca2+-binding RTX toxin-like protein
LNGGTGNDRIRTGSGADRIVYRSAKEGVDTILDFNVAMDGIDLRRIFNRPEYTSANPFRDYIRLSNGADGAILRVDADGGAAEEFVRLAVLQGVEVSSLSRVTNFRV